MDMDDTSPQFKVLWLNATLKFVKNNQELIYKYPEWPITRVKFFHALISQRQSDVGLGFKSLYAPLWEAMQIFSVSYTYKVSIINTSEDKGRLVFQKIPKKVEQEDEMDSEDESTCRHKLTKKSEKLYTQNKKIIETISPTFLKTSLQSLLEFINDEASASIDFKDLAPIEAMFIENVQAIHNNKHLFYKLLSPACIDILKKITLSLSSSKNMCIKVCNAKTNGKTAKREITIVKEPNFDNTTTSLATCVKKQNKSSKSSVESLRKPKCLNPVTIVNKPETESSRKNETSPVDSKPITASVHFVKNNPEKEKIVSSNGEQNSTTLTATLAKSKTGESPNPSVKQSDKDLKTKATVEAMSKPLESEKGLRTESSRKNETSPVDSKPVPASTTSVPFVKNNPEKEKIVSPNGGQNSKILTETSEKSKIGKSPNTSVKLSGKGLKNKAIIEAMSKPLESDKGLRMMQLMGWEGGSLGLRGDGITEPLIPALHLKPGAGFGHNVSQIENGKGHDSLETKDRVQRNQFLEGILEVLSKGEAIIQFDKALKEKKVILFQTAIKDFNRRTNVNFKRKREKKIVNEILNELVNDPDKKINFAFNSTSELKLTLLSKEKTQTKTPTNNNIEITERSAELEQKEAVIKKNDIGQMSLVDAKVHVLNMVLDFVKNEDIKMQVDLSSGYSKKLNKYMKEVCKALNNGTVAELDTKFEVDLVKNIGRNMNKTVLNMEMYYQVLVFSKANSSENKAVASVKFDRVKENITDRTNPGNINSKLKEVDCNKNNMIIPNSIINVEIKPNSQDILLKEETNNKLGINGGASKDESNNIFLNVIKAKAKDSTLEKKMNTSDSSNCSNIAVEHVCKKLSSKVSIDTCNKNKCNGDIVRDLKNNDDNFHFVNGSNSDSRNQSTNLDTINFKNNGDVTENGQSDIIDVIEYNEYNIIKIDLRDNLEKLPSNIQGHILKYKSNFNNVKCHGIQNGELIYSSDGDWLKNMLAKNFNIKCLNRTIDKFKMKVNINSFVNVNDVLDALEVYNKGLNTIKWIVSKKEIDYFIVYLDRDSFKFICEHHFSLFAGIDTAFFTVLL